MEYGYKTYTGVTLTDSQVNQYNALSQDIEQHPSVEHRELMLNDRHRMFSIWSIGS